MLEEKRKFPRLEINVNVNWSRIPVLTQETPKNFDLARTHNISAGGICLIVDENIPLGELLALDIELPTSKVIHAQGRLVWIKEFSIIGGRVEYRYDAGIEFTDISDENRDEIKKFVFSILRK